MKTLKQTIILIASIGCIFFSGCKHDCINLNCNSGKLNLDICECDCPNGFSGLECEIEDLCLSQSINCLNGGTCVEGICECPIGYIGLNCEHYDISEIQFLLNSGISPFDLIRDGIPIDSLIGKNYQAGIIFYIDVITGQGMVSMPENFPGKRFWGNDQYNTAAPNVLSEAPMNGEETEVGARIGDGLTNSEIIIETENTMALGSVPACELCMNYSVDGFDDWYLPSRGELNLIYENLDKPGLGGFEPGMYWTSTEMDEFLVWAQDLGRNDGLQSIAIKSSPHWRVLGIRNFSE